MAGNVQVVTDSTFGSEVLEAQDLVVVDFWAAWCGPCRALSPVIQQLASQYCPEVKFAKVNVDENPRVAETYRIQGLPTLLFFKHGQRVGELIGLQPQDSIAQKIQQLRSVSTSNVPASTIITCPSCGQKNRVPNDRRNEAVCGRCHASLFSDAQRV